MMIAGFQIKYGEVSERKSGFVRVAFDDEETVSYWLPVLVRKSRTDKESWPLEIHEHVVCLMDQFCEDGVCLGAIPNDQDTPDPGEAPGKFRKLFNDGTLIEYDRNAHKLTVDVKGELIASTEGKCTINAGGDLEAVSGGDAEISAGASLKGNAVVKATVTAPDIELTGAVKITGPATIVGPLTCGGLSVSPAGGATGNMSIQGNIDLQGKIDATGDVTTTGDVKAGAISLSTHKHTSASSGNPTSVAIP